MNADPPDRSPITRTGTSGDFPPDADLNAVHPDSIQAMLERANATARIGPWEYDCRAKVLWWSDVTRELHDEPPGFIPDLATAIRFYATPEDRETIRQAFTALVDRGTPYDLELRIRTAKGRLRWVRTLATATRKRGRTARVSGTFQDITAAVELREQLLKERDF